jgi:hypothetical protein
MTVVPLLKIKYASHQPNISFTMQLFDLRNFKKINTIIKRGSKDTPHQGHLTPRAGARGDVR